MSRLICFHLDFRIFYIATKPIFLTFLLWKRCNKRYFELNIRYTILCLDTFLKQNLTYLQCSWHLYTHSQTNKNFSIFIMMILFKLLSFFNSLQIEIQTHTRDIYLCCDMLSRQAKKYFTKVHTMLRVEGKIYKIKYIGRCLLKKRINVFYTSNICFENISIVKVF